MLRILFLYLVWKRVQYKSLRLCIMCIKILLCVHLPSPHTKKSLKTAKNNYKLTKLEIKAKNNIKPNIHVRSLKRKCTKQKKNHKIKPKKNKKYVYAIGSVQTSKIITNALISAFFSVISLLLFGCFLVWFLAHFSG